MRATRCSHGLLEAIKKALESDRRFEFRWPWLPGKTWAES
jgi:hypothetical protein